MNESSPNNCLPIAGIRLGIAEAAIKRPGRPDLLVIELAPGSTTSAVFTQNAFCAAPVTVAREHLATVQPRLWLVNSGNANAGTGRAGLSDVRETCTALGHLTGYPATAVLPFSTGVIGTRLPVERLCAALPTALASLSEDGWRAAAHAIMTTDTVPKTATRRISVDNRWLTVTGIAKGAGMIRPDMATLLAFLATDAAVPKSLLDRCLTQAVAHSFNRITVEGDTSTNDACVLAATGQGNGGSPVSIDRPEGTAWEALCEAVGDVCKTLAQAIIRDGEGATRFVTVRVEAGENEDECLTVAYAVAHSPLVKTALFAGDPNWGRILAAVGRSGLPRLDVSQVEIYLDEACVVRKGEPEPDYREEAGAAVLAQPEYTLRIVLGRGAARADVWTCDLSYEYVRINAEYRS